MVTVLWLWLQYAFIIIVTVVWLYHLIVHVFLSMCSLCHVLQLLPVTCNCLAIELLSGDH